MAEKGLAVSTPLSVLIIFLDYTYSLNSVITMKKRFQMRFPKDQTHLPASSANNLHLSYPVHTSLFFSLVASTVLLFMFLTFREFLGQPMQLCLRSLQKASALGFQTTGNTAKTQTMRSARAIQTKTTANKTIKEERKEDGI